MGRFRLEVPLAVQIGAVVVLFAAAPGDALVYELRGRRARGAAGAGQRPLEGGERPARGPGQGRSRRGPAVPRFHGGRAIGRARPQALRGSRPHPGAYRASKGVTTSPRAASSHSCPPSRTSHARARPARAHGCPCPAPSPPRRNLYDYVDTQVDAAYRKRNELSVVEDIPPYTVAIRTAPVRVNGRVVAATWTMTRLVDPIFLDQSAPGLPLVRGPGAGRDRPVARPDRPAWRGRSAARRPSASGSGPSCGGASAWRRWASSSPGSPTRSATPWPASAASPSSGSAGSAWATRASTT